MSSTRRLLHGHPQDEAAPQQKCAGWHWEEWLSQYLGTAKR